jgi:hypothetical protein
MQIEQAIYRREQDRPECLARSPGFRDDWLPLADQLCLGFGQRPEGVACPLAVFARPLGRQVAVVQTADPHGDRPNGLLFRLLVLPRSLYVELGGDPFHLAEQLPPSWETRDELPALAPPAPSPYRTVGMLRQVLDVPDSPTLLGGVQALLDGGRLVFERSGPDPNLLHSLWMLLPVASRSEMWPASFAFGNAHGFHVVVLPPGSGPAGEGYVTEAQAGDYPEGNYELSLQAAVEGGNQAEVDALFARRSRSQMMTLGLVLLVAFALAALFLAQPPPPSTHTTPVPKNQPKEAPVEPAPQPGKE